jgi:hypothetical protein
MCIRDRLIAMDNATMAYGNVPSTANCNAYLNAIRGYIETATPLLECPNLTAEEKSNIQLTIDAANATLVTIPC